ncbi:hypothetical protein [Aeromonas simiae]|uniref:hypothetical protein n=1 Tax=Aeromonas simiae TaxID=218936 RepID=UPI0005A689C0|nr:hypothetical protein [Aeromonas simiae]MDO2949111.1 hypothetical protein [Aeromonas simiae]MDO2953947.1 hypothetical protein [Aeromonas simiae]MDO2956294.1 hypothetical protein [Aeromonas simiae]
MKNFFIFGVAFFLMLLIFCQVYFYTKEKIKFSDSNGVFIFINKVMFQSCLLTNLSSLFFFMSFIMGLALSWAIGESREKIFSYGVGLCGIISIFCHCRIFYVKGGSTNELDFFNELFLRCEMSRSTIFIWISRLCYLISFSILFYYN